MFTKCSENNLKIFLLKHFVCYTVIPTCDQDIYQPCVYVRIMSLLPVLLTIAAVWDQFVTRIRTHFVASTM